MALFRKHKYGAQPTEVDGVRFASKAEAKRYAHLKLLEREGVIWGLVLQPKYELQAKYTTRYGESIRAIHYVGDFQYKEPHGVDGQLVVEDVKGMETDVFKIKRKLFMFKYPHIKLVLVK
jgi:hypothetical protein